ncbi:hypothetical protein B0H63DRAFT_454965 [Podospora didyma]|uniref:Uncharacterized protein n=1 Tax=Podospora didyma TaxID=330526 RepID=A0AAE0K1E1_9PEZI|nr:hypothetical protein B0H63DRAFT_454965 [Podospora didyma]
MSEKPTGNVIGSSSSPFQLAKSPDSDVSPRTTQGDGDYFSPASGSGASSSSQAVLATAAKEDGAASLNAASLIGASSTTASTTTSSSAPWEPGFNSERRPSQTSSDHPGPGAMSRKSSSASVSFRAPRNPSLPQGNPRKTDNRRLRESSPSPVSPPPYSMGSECYAF